MGRGRGKWKQRSHGILIADRYVILRRHLRSAILLREESADSAQKTYTPLTLSRTSASGTTTNTTFAVPLDCGNRGPFEKGQMNIQTIFEGKGTGSLTGKLRQRVKFRWLEPKMRCLMDEQCLVTDIDGRVVYPEECG